MVSVIIVENVHGRNLHRYPGRLFFRYCTKFVYHRSMSRKTLQVMKVIRIPAVYMNWIVHVRNICSLCKDLDEVEIDDLELLMNDEVDPQSAHWSSAIVHKSEK